MTFSEALARLPECSHAVTKSSFMGEPEVEVWFLFQQDAEELGDPMAEDGPWWQPSDVPGEVPERAKAAGWHESAIEGEGEYPFGFFVNVVLKVLEGESLEEAKGGRDWPDKWQSFVR
jgi:hypothetical protein